MNDDLDQFEQRLRRQPVKQIPGEWRAEILSAAAANVNQRQAAREITVASTNGSWFNQLSSLFWPHPKAWAGLAAVWVFIFVLNFSTRDKSPQLAAKAPPSSPEVMVQLRQQHQMLAELIGPSELRVADRPRIVSPKPRSERLETLAA